MKKTFQLILLVCFTLFLNNKSFADSPLTSIDLWTIYSEEPIVKHALKTRELDKEALNYLLDENNSLEKKIAVISAIGWKFKSSSQKSSKLLKAILKKYKLKSIEDLNDIKFASLLAVFTYSLALENYFEVDEAYNYSQIANNLDPQNSIIKFISTLIKSQQYLHADDWCSVYKSFEEIKDDQYFKKDKGRQFLVTAMEYIGGYSTYCK
jgi:hypothetical protein